ncbi:hypothetical protein JCM3765_007722 [Sporobolomyces pararoseus]
MDCLTPPPTPPHRDQLGLSPLTSSPPPTSPLTETNNNNNHNHNDTTTTYNNNSLAQINSLLLRSRCDSEKTLLDQTVEQDEEGQETVQLRVTLQVEVGSQGTRQEIIDKIEYELREFLNGNRQNTGGGQGEITVNELQNIEEELKLVRRQLKRAQQSIQDLRSNNQNLRLQACEAIKISHQAEQDLDKVLEAFKLKRGDSTSTRRGGGGSSWVVVFALLVWVVFINCS